MTPPRLAVWLIRCAADREERGDVLADLADEAAQHAAQAGASAARRWYWHQTRRSIGPLLARRVSRLGWRAPLRGVRQDLRFARRSLVRAPAFSVAVIAMLAIGIGAHTAVFAVVDGLALRPLPFGDRSPRLVTLHSTHPTLEQDWSDSRISYPDLLDFRRESTTLEGLEGVVARNVSLTADGGTNRVMAASVTPGLFALLGTAPVMGRDFVDADAAPTGRESVAIVSYGLWQAQFGSDRGAIGRTIVINGRALIVVGVMPPGFSFPEGQQLWLPYRAEIASGDRQLRSILGVGLVHREAGLGQAALELEALAGRLATRFPDTNRDWSVHTTPIRDEFVSGSGASLLLGAISLVMLVACANVAGLMLARGIGRGREIALRAALGASRARLVRLVILEAAMLALAGGALGLAIASWAVRVFVAWNPEPPPYWATPSLDFRVAAFAVILTAAVATLSGLVPAIRSSRIDAGVLLGGARNAGGPRSHRRLQRLLVAGQVAVSLALLVGAMLLTRSATALLHADGGFKVDALLSLRVYLAGDRYDPPEARAAVVDEIERRLNGIPGVRAAAATGSIPTDDGGVAIRIAPPSDPGNVAAEVGAQMIPATSRLWGALDLALVDGRTFTAAELTDARQRVAIVNRRLAARFFPGESAVGRTLRVAEATGRSDLRIVGVAPDLVYEEFSEETPQSQLNVFVPYIHAAWRTQALLISVLPEPASVVETVRREIRAIDPGIAIYDVRTMADRRAFNHWAEQFIGRAFAAFAIAALVLAVIGAYGIAAYMAAQRTREVGIRVAIGATARDVLQLFLGDTSRLALVGTLAGIPLALALVRVLESDLFRVSPWTTAIWIEPPMLVLAAMLVAGYLPARRASRTDPVVALRAE